jgi:hypothetical protein
MRRTIIILIALFININADEISKKNQLIIQPYGFFKFDMSYDRDLMSAGNFARWALPNSSNESIPTTNITAKQSRFGMNINKGDINGKVEIDFYGVGSAENKGGVLLRKAYAEAKLEIFTIRAGQDSDVISPLLPSTINYPVAWWAGNIGYRRPMLKIFGTQKSISWILALARNIGGDLNNDGIDDGAAALLPEFQGRVALSVFDNHVVGLSCHYAQLDTLGANGKYKSWSANLDLNLKITPTITLSAEAFIGSNTSSHFGGIGNASSFDGIATQGGWLNLKIKPKSNYSFSTGISMDDPRDCDLLDGARSKNTMAFANIYQNVLEGFLIGCEVSYWSTEYKNMVIATVMRGQLAFLYKF